MRWADHFYAVPNNPYSYQTAEIETAAGKIEIRKGQIFKGEIERTTI